MNKNNDLNKADVVIKNAKVFNSYFRKFYEADIYIKNGKFFHIDNNKNSKLKTDTSIDALGRYVIPGLIDIHMHIESSMMTPAAFCERLVECGVTTIVSEPHEMANVNGINGILDMILAGKNSPVSIFYAIPSCVPSTSDALETTGGVIRFEDMKKLKEHPNVICVGEVMNYRQIIKENNLEITKFLEYVKKHDSIFPIEGHCPALVDFDLSKFLYLGINGDHTEHTLEEFRQRFASGMFIELQEKMLSLEVLELIEQNNLYEYFCFVTDDVMADVFIEHGHLDAIVRKAIFLGMRPEQAIYNASFTSAKRMNLFDRGSIDPGKIADFVMLDNLEDFDIYSTYKNGMCIYEKDNFHYNYNLSTGFNGTYYHSIKLESQSEDIFNIPIENIDSVMVRVMEIQDRTTKTKEKLVSMPVKNGFLSWEDSGCLLTVVLERYGKNGNIGYGFITGDCHKNGAIASSYAHDSHNIIVSGSNKSDMLLALNRIIQLQGGILTVHNNTVISELQLNIGGILSGSSAKETGNSLKLVRKSMHELGYKHYNPIMSFCTITLPVSPELKLTDKGLVSVNDSKPISLIVQ